MLNKISAEIICFIVFYILCLYQSLHNTVTLPLLGQLVCNYSYLSGLGWNYINKTIVYFVIFRLLILVCNCLKLKEIVHLVKSTFIHLLLLMKENSKTLLMLESGTFQLAAFGYTIYMKRSFLVCLLSKLYKIFVFTYIYFDFELHCREDVNYQTVFLVQ